jgi:hypothetical protein
MTAQQLSILANAGDRLASEVLTAQQKQEQEQEQEAAPRNAPASQGRNSTPRTGSADSVNAEELARYKATMPLGSGRNRTISDTAIINRILREREQEAAQARADSADIARQNIEALSSSEQRVLSRTGAAPNDMLSRLVTTGTPLQIPEAGIAALLPPPASAPTATTAPTPDLLDPRGPHQIPTAPLTVGGAAPTTGDTIPTPEQTAASFETPQTAAAADTGIMAPQGTTSADSAFLRGTQMADDYTGRAAASKSFEDMKSRLSEFDEANYGPNDDLNAFLIGMGGTGSIGSAMKGGYNAMNRSKSNRRNRMMDEFQLEKDRIGADAVFSTSGIKLGTQLAADAAANERNIRSAAATLGAAKIRAATEDANRLVEVYKAELKSVDDAAARAAQVATNDRLGDQTRLTAAINIQSDVAKTRSTMLESQLGSSMTLQRLEMAKAKAVTDNDTEALTAINQNIAAETAQIALTVESVLNTPTPSGINLLELESTAADTIRRLMGVSGLTEDDVAGVEVDGE